MTHGVRVQLKREDGTVAETIQALPKMVNDGS